MAQTILFFLLFLHLFLTLTTSHDTNTTKLPKFSALLIFGDSFLDTGNNDYILTPLKCNHPPYGCDFTDHIATGRFSDGLLVSDLLSSELGLKELSPPFLDPKLSDSDLMTGVNFASSAAGYDDLTSILSNTLPISRQIEMFKAYLARLRGVVGVEEATRIINNALIVVSAGANDMVLNFYDIPSRRPEFNISGYQDFLLQKVQGLVKELYDAGGRAIGIAGLPPIGCSPIQITAKLKFPLDRRCIDEQNSDSVVYNSKLQKLIVQMRQSFPGSKVVYANLYDPLMDILNNPQKYGFEETKRGCCGTGFFEAGPLCNSLTPMCTNSSAYVFFDSIHPTERVYKLITKNIIENVVPQLH